MDIGFVASGSAEDALRRATRLGFDGIELNFLWNTACDLDHWSADDSKRVRDTIAATGARVLAICTGWANHLAPDKAGRERAAANMARAIAAAREMGTTIVTCNAFGDPSIRPEQQIDAFKDVFTEYARQAEDNGVRIGIENCPHAHREHGIEIGNMAYSPEIFEQIFEAVPSTAVGLEYDPSHFYWLGVDYVGVIKQFATRLVYAHAKDAEIMKDKLARVSIYGKGWWRYRMPGMGEIDWAAIRRAFAEVGYDKGMVIEHEDPVFKGDRFEEGLSLGLKFLQRTF